MKLSLLIFLFVLSVITKAQPPQPNHVSSKAKALYNKAMQQLNDGMVKESVPLLQKAISLDTNYVDAYLSLASAYGELKDYSKAISFFEKARNMDPSNFSEFTLPYSINLAGAGKFKEALNAVTIFLSLPGINERTAKAALYRKRSYEFAVNFQQKQGGNPYIFTPVNLGDSVNSAKSEYYPSVSIDDSLLIFTRRGEGAREDFMETTLVDGHYTAAKQIAGDINIEPSKGAITVSADGEWMIFAGNFRTGMGNFDLYISYLTPQGWSEPENLGPNVNSEYWDSSPSLSPDNRILYFSSNRPGGYGGSDLYTCTRLSNGKWGPAKNMGPVINTVGDETSPYIHADNQTLYFTSDGLQGYGGSDLFICRKKNGEWGAPQNLGYPVNTIENEGSLAVSSDGSTAYYASDRSDSRGGLDLYKFELREDIRPIKTLYVKGKVSDAITGKGLPCAVDLVDNSNNSTLMHLQTDELGKYFVPLPSGKDYTFTVNRKGYLYHTELYELSKKQSDSTYQKDIMLQPLTINSTVIFNNIQFAIDSSNLLPVSKIELDKLVQLMIDNSTVKIQILGHTDNTGNEKDNLLLSTSRARTVAYYLLNNGIDSKRLSYKGFGSSKPIADNTTEQGRAKNRRTEFVIKEM
jgi:outer membrane protein OmpA-like peptidoglycan-associated protein